MPDKITVVPYDAEWPKLLQRLGHELRAALQNLANQINHIGSQSATGGPIDDVLRKR